MTLRGKKVYESNFSDSFSFFNRIHLCAEMNESEKAVVLEHECIHSYKKHSIDLIAMGIYHCFFWFNPIIFWVKRELINVHEFEVDEQMYQKHSQNYIRELLSYSFGSPYAHHLLTSRFFNHLTLAKRIKTMKKIKKRNNKIIILIPALMLGLSLVSWTGKNNDKSPDLSQLSELEQLSKLSGLSKLSELSGLSTLNQNKEGKIDKRPEFKGGNQAQMDYMIKSIKYPKSVKEGGTVMVGFTISKKGAVTKAKIVKSVHPLLDEEALRVVKGMPDWVPGEKDGKTVAVQLVLPIKFS